ncbi:MAG: DUF1445 domain-containing protein [Chloroflexota bacterium]
MSVVLAAPDKFVTMKPKEFRQVVRRNEYTGGTGNVCAGYARTAMAIIPKDFALDFFMFCHRNPSPFPIIDFTEPGSPHPMRVAPEADMRTDVTNYHVYINGKLEAKVTDIMSYWRDDLVVFLTGCSRGFDAALVSADIKYRSIGVFSTNISCVPAGRFKGPMRTSCRLVKGARDVVRTIQISSRYPAYHGAPIHVGDPAVIGIKDLYHPDVLSRGEAISPLEPDEVPMFWGCGMTLKAVAMASKPPLMITEGDGAMFVTDLLASDLAISS